MSSTRRSRMTRPPDRTPLPVRLRHRITGRTRFGLMAPLPDRDMLRDLADHMAGLDGVESVEIRISTGSVLVHHRNSFEALSGTLIRERLLFIVPDRPEPAFDPAARTAQALAGVEATVMAASGGAVDLRKSLFTLLVLAGLVQLARGRIAGPAVTLFAQAASLMALPSSRDGAKR